MAGNGGKNAILLVDRTDRLRQAGLSRSAALLQAGPTRLRPIVMTTLSVMAALVPVATGIEEGSELLQSVALVLIGGLRTSTLLTLVFVPAMYTIFDDVQELVLRLFRREPAAGSERPPRRPRISTRRVAPAMLAVSVDGTPASDRAGRSAGGSAAAD